MKLLESFRQRLHFHEGEAAKYRTTIELIEEVSQPQLKSALKRKINGAMREHLATRESQPTEIDIATVARRGRKKGRRKKGGGHQHLPPPPGWIKGAIGAMSFDDAIKKALSAGPLGQNALAVEVDRLRGTPTNRNSLLVSCAKLAKKRIIAAGKLKRGVYALPRHRGRIPAVEAKLNKLREHKNGSADASV